MNSLIKQYQTNKASYLEAIVLFRVGDNYETFNEDAILVTQILGLTLIKSDTIEQVREAASFPHFSLDAYLHKLVKAGHKVAVCEQLEDPHKNGGLIKRCVTNFKHP